MCVYLYILCHINKSFYLYTHTQILLDYINFFILQIYIIHSTQVCKQFFLFCIQFASNPALQQNSFHRITTTRTVFRKCNNPVTSRHKSLSHTLSETRERELGAPDVGSVLWEREAGHWVSGGARLVSDNNGLAFSVLPYPILFLYSQGRCYTRPHVEDETPAAMGLSDSQN